MNKLAQDIAAAVQTKLAYATIDSTPYIRAGIVNKGILGAGLGGLIGAGSGIAKGLWDQYKANSGSDILSKVKRSLGIHSGPTAKDILKTGLKGGLIGGTLGAGAGSIYGGTEASNKIKSVIKQMQADEEANQLAYKKLIADRDKAAWEREQQHQKRLDDAYIARWQEDRTYRRNKILEQQNELKQRLKYLRNDPYGYRWKYYKDPELNKKYEPSTSYGWTSDLNNKGFIDLNSIGLNSKLEKLQRQLKELEAEQVHYV